MRLVVVDVCSSLSCSDDFDTSFGDPEKKNLLSAGLQKELYEKRISQEGLFELRAPLAIDGRGGPVVRPVHNVPVRTEVDHLRIGC